MMLLFFISLSLASKIVEYKFGHNFGDFFADYSGNGNSGINGLTLATETGIDAMPTDRGAYFSSQSMITLPPNTLKPYSFNFTNEFLLTTWIYAKGTSSGIITSSSNSQGLQIASHINNNSLTSYYSLYSNTSGSIILPSVKLNEWSFIAIYAYNYTLQFYNNGAKLSSYISTSNFTGLNTNSIGSFNQPGFIGYIWSYTLYDKFTDLSLLVSASMLVGGDRIASVKTYKGNCTVSIISSGIRYCMPLINSTDTTSTDSNGFICSESCMLSSTSCSGTLCLVCPSRQSCVISGDLVVIHCQYDPITCPCPTGKYHNGEECVSCDARYPTCNSSKMPCSVIGTTSSSICTCPSYYYAVEGSSPLICSPCHQDCEKCTNSTMCQTCRAFNSIPDSTLGCQCKQGYYKKNNICVGCYMGSANCTQSNQCSTCLAYNTINITASCLLCHIDCATCQVFPRCLTCLDPNAEPDIIEGCNCKAGYYKYNGYCMPCQSQCSSCQDAGCLACINTNTPPSLGQNCTCINGYYRNVTAGALSCSLCNSSCITCNANATCLTCVDQNSRVDATGYCVCKDGYYYNNTCVACHQNCTACNNGQTCLACVDHKTIANATGYCVCRDGYYYNETCMACSKNCKTCSTYGVCMSCNSISFLNSTQGCACKDGYYENMLECFSCYKECSKCSDGLTCTTCIAQNSFPSSVQGCICNPGYYGTNLTNATSCKTCRPDCATCINYDYCLTCATGYLQSPELLCVNYCSMGENLAHNLCVRTPQQIFSYTFVNLNNTYQSNGHNLYMGLNDNFWPDYDDFDPVIYNKRGALFTASSVMTYGFYKNPSSIYIGNTHTFDMFIFITKDGLILSVDNSTTQYISCFIKNSTLYVSYSIIKFNLTSTLLDGFPIKSNKWTRISWSLSYSLLTLSLSVAADNVFLSMTSASNFQYNQPNVSYFTIGKRLQNESFMGYLYKISLYNYKLTVLNTPKCACSDCGDQGECLISCPPNNYWDSVCKSCLSYCTNGCGNGDNCNPHIDPNCQSFYNTSAPCKTCNPFYSISNQICEKCVRYLQNSDVSGQFSANYIQLTVSFNVSISGVDCAQIFTQATLDKFGSGYSCEFLPNMTGLIITLGDTYSLTNETIVLNHTILKGTTSECGYNMTELSVQLKYVYDLPKPEPVISAPATIFFECQELTVNGLMSSGGLKNPLDFLWEFSMNGIIFYSLSYSSTALVTVPSSLISSGLIKVHLTVRNKFNITSTTNALVEAKKSDSLSIQFDSKLECVSYKTCIFYLADIKSCMQNPQYNISWSFTKSPKGVKTSQISEFWAAQNSQKSIKIPGIFIPQQLYMMVNAVETQSKLTGKLNITISILPVPPSIVFKPSAGSISLLKDFVLDASQSIDPSLVNLTTFTWYCSYQNAECAGNYTKTGMSLKISQAELIAQPFDYLLLTITSPKYISRRLASQETLNTTAKYLGSFVRWVVPNVTITEYYTGYQPTLIPSSKNLTFNATVQDFGTQYTVLWTANSSRNCFSSAIDKTSVVINPSMLDSGSEYQLKFQVAAAGRSSIFFYNFKVNSPPILGSFKVNPSSGTELSTEFSLLASDWIDPESNLPLLYSFGYKSNDKVIFYKINSELSLYTTQLPINVNGIDLILRVYDSLGDFSEKIESVVVTKDLNFNSTAFVGEAEKALASASVSDLASLIMITASSVLNRDTVENSTNATSDANNALVKMLQSYIKVLIENSVGSESSVSQSLDLMSSLMSSPDVVNNENLNSTLELVGLLINSTESIDPAVASKYYDVMNSSIAINTDTIYNNTQGVGLMQNFTELIEGGLAPNLVPNQPYTITTGLISSTMLAVDSEDLNSLTLNNSGSKVTLPDDFSQYMSSATSTLSFTEITLPEASTNSTPSLVFLNVLTDSSVSSIKLNNSFITISVPVQGLSTITNATCVYFDSSTNNWSTNGCELVDVLQDSIVCRCSHLSLFSAGDGTIGGGFFPKNNIDATVNIDALMKVDATSAIGIYFCCGLILLYVVVSVLTCRLDRRDMRAEQKVENNDVTVIAKDETSIRVMESLEECKSVDEIKNKDNTITDIKLFTKVADLETSCQGEDKLKSSERGFKVKHKSYKNLPFDSSEDGEGTRNEIFKKNIFERSKSTINIEHKHPTKLKKLSKSKTAIFREKSLRIELLKAHKFFNMFYLYSPEKTRFARATIFFFNLLGNMFFIGLFYSSGKKSTNVLTLAESLKSYGLRDILVLFYSLLIMAVVEFIVVLIGNAKSIPKDCSVDEAHKLQLKNKIRAIIRITIAWALMIYFCWSIMMFALQFGIGVSFKWVTSSVIKLFTDIFISSFIMSGLKTFVIIKLIDKFRSRKQVNSP